MIEAVASPRATAERGEAPIVLALTALLVIVSLVRPGGAAAGLALVLSATARKRRAPAASSLCLLLVTCPELGLAGLVNTITGTPSVRRPPIVRWRVCMGTVLLLAGLWRPAFTPAEIAGAGSFDRYLKNAAQMSGR